MYELFLHSSLANYPCCSTEYKITMIIISQNAVVCKQKGKIMDNEKEKASLNKVERAKIGQRSLIFIEERIRVGYPHVVKMSFELPYLDWCRFENSELFLDLKSYLEELQKQQIQIPHPRN